MIYVFFRITAFFLAAGIIFPNGTPKLFKICFSLLLSAMIAINVVMGVLLLGGVTCFVLWGYVFKKNDVIEVYEGNDNAAGGDDNEENA